VGDADQQIIDAKSSDSMNRLHEMLDALVRLLEQRSPETRGSILLLDDDGVTLRHGAAPSLPASFRAAVDGVTIGPASGSCGVAAYSAEQVISADIATDPIWERFRDLMREYDIAAAWSTPIRSGGGRMLGTFAMYYATQRAPTADDLEFGWVAASVAGSLIERGRAEDALRASERLLTEQASELRKQTLELAHRETAFRFLAEAIPVHVWTARSNGKTEFVTERTARYFGRTPEQLISDGWASIVHPDDARRCRERWQRSLKLKQPFEIEYRLFSAEEGGYRWHLGRAHPQCDESSRVVRWFGTATDIEDQKRVEAARDDALREADVARAAEAEANRARTHFVNMVTHELRTPLGAIGGYIDLLLAGLRGPVNDAQRADITRMSVNQQHMRRLIDDILLLAKLEANQLPVDAAPVRVADVVAAATPMVEPQLLAKQLRYHTHIEPPGLSVVADAGRLQQIVINLVANAIRFTPPGGTITLDCESGATDADRSAPMAVLRVRDTGEGIPADKLDQIFEPFFQLHTPHSQSADGTGLGLTISREFARRMQGELVAERGSGDGGASFILSLPRGVPIASADPTTTPSGPSTGGDQSRD
jgi:PAS domain S-box-containing protein